MSDASLKRLREAVELFRGGANWDLWQHVQWLLAEQKATQETARMIASERDRLRAELAQERARAARFDDLRARYPHIWEAPEAERIEAALALASAYMTWKRQRRHLDQDSSCSKDVCAMCDALALAEDAYARGEGGR